MPSINRRDLIASGVALSLGGAVEAAPADLAELGVRDAADRIRRGQLKAERYAEALIARYQAHRNLNVAINFDPNRVLEQARAVDMLRARPGPFLGGLAGVPFVVKDQVEVLGYITTSGTPALRNYQSRRTSPVVQALLNQGAVLFSKANMHELAGGRTTTNPTFGFARNPYDPTRIPGGSSGGPAAAVAARIVPFAIGEDTGGSIRSPAGYCGIAGLRPSSWPVKLYSPVGMVPPANADDLQTLGPMARTVADLAYVHEMITGRASRRASLRSVRIGVPTRDFYEQPLQEPTIAEAAKEAFARLRAAGAQLVEIDYDPFVKLGERLQPVVSMGERDEFAAWLAENTPGLTLADLAAQIASRDVKASYARPRGAGFKQSPEERRAIRAQANAERTAIFKQHGIAAIAFPHPRLPAPPVNEDGDPAEPTVTVNGKTVSPSLVNDRYSILAPRFGAPGLVVPAGMNGHLPFGIEMDGLPGEDSALLGLGMALEAVWGRTPPPLL